MDYFEKPVSDQLIAKGGIVEFHKVTVELPNGKLAGRDLVKHPGASVVVPVSDDGCVYMVRQYRTPAKQETIEIPAGKLDAGEDPLVCAARELAEETGFTGTLHHLSSYYSTPGFSDEVLHMYLATNLKQNDAHPDEDEFISTEKYTIAQLVEMIFNGTIVDGKTIIGILVADRYFKGELGISME